MMDGFWNKKQFQDSITRLKSFYMRYGYCAETTDPRADGMECGIEAVYRKYAGKDTYERSKEISRKYLPIRVSWRVLLRLGGIIEYIKNLFLNGKLIHRNCCM